MTEPQQIHPQHQQTPIITKLATIKSNENVIAKAVPTAWPFFGSGLSSSVTTGDVGKHSSKSVT